MLAPKCATYNGRSTFANPKYLKIAQSKKPCLYEIPYDTSDHANRFCPNGEETVTLEKESRSKLNKDTVKPYDYTYQNSLYEIFKPPSKTYLDQLERAKEVRKTMWRKTESLWETQIINHLLLDMEMLKDPKPSVLGKPTPFSNSPEMRSFQTKQSVNKTNVSDGLFNQVTLQNLPQNRKQAEIHSNVLKPGMHRIATSTKQNREPQLPHASRNTNPHVSKSTGVTHPTSVSRPQLKSYQVKDKVVPNISQVKFTKKEVEDHHRISSISKKTKSVTVCTNTTNSRTSNVNAVCAECGKCVFNSNHDACVSRYLNVMNARTKKPNVVPIGDSKPKRKANKSVATTHKKTVASDTTIQKPKSYFKELYENTNKAWKWWIEKKCPSEYKWTQTTPSRPNLKWKPTGRIFSNVRFRWIPTGKLFNSCTGKVDSEPTHVSIVDIPHIHASKQTLGLSAADQASVFMAMMYVHISSGLVLHQMTSDHNRSELGIHDHSNEPSSSKLVPKVVPLAVKTATSRQELELLFHHHIAMLRTTGINPMIQPEPEDLPKDNPKLEIAVLRWQYAPASEY
ncbi:hypothetical protein Tco_0137709 [Tanacetum coccineum]